MRRPMVPVGLLSSVACAAALILSPAARAADADVKTARLWKAKCSACHGVDGKADTDSGKKLKIPDMTKPAWQKLTTEAAMKKAITDGIKREGMAEGMDGFKEKLTPEQIDLLAGYVRSLGK